MRTNVIRIITVLLSFCILINLGYQVYLRLSDPYQTEIVYDYTLNDSVQTQGLVFKDETIIQRPEGEGVVKYLYQNGDKIAKGANVAMLYQNEADVAATAQIEQLTAQIEQLQEAQSEGVKQEANISVVNQQLTNTYVEFIQQLEQGGGSDYASYRNDLTFMLNKRQIVTQKVTDFNGQIQTLNQQKSDLEASITSQPQAVNTSQAGYFEDKLDGYEEQLTHAYSDTVTANELKQLLEQYKEPDPSAEQQANIIGKVMTKPDLRYVALVPTAKLDQVKQGQTCTLRFEDVDAVIEAEIYRIDKNPQQQESLVVFSITQITGNLISIRQNKAEVIFNSHTGLKIPKTALHTSEDGTPGVYIKHGANLNFKKVEILYENEEYILCAHHSTEQEYLQLYDTIIVQGKDLYDGKPIR